uniref:Zinc transporter ZupT n=1 Tax=Amphora coffeiformis TaxID=265554 RepID=A0A7S3L455_9STRA|mmetsp:Transcript_13043/g.24739  ORF Transcript_13043/g.24739 Transcript_13043/m.24739 type:complete len:319 (-) Transcript_13043:197-1153(-)
MTLQTAESGKAFALVIAAGAATAVGASAVFSPRLIALANKESLSASLAFAAGVMLYVSLVDIYGKSMAGFEANGHDGDKAFNYTTITFFSGMLLMKIIDHCINACLNHAYSPEDNIEAFLEQADENRTVQPQTEHNPSSEDPENPDGISDEEVPTQSGLLVSHVPKEKLFAMGASTAIAICIHNFPEGLVTFASYISDPAIGITLAAAIAIHNIPEGLCVAVPIFYATGSRWKAFAWALLSGASEPIGALIGWTTLNQSFTGNTNGILFGLVAGIMTYICIDELLPTAIKYDTKGRIVTPCVVMGMALIAGSLILFTA